MRTRKGYVSNSSSSSFVVMYNDKAKLRIGPCKKGAKASEQAYFTVKDFIDMIDRSPDYCSERTELVADGIDNVKSYLTEKDSYGFQRYDEEYSWKMLEKIGSNSGKYGEAAIFRIEYGDKLARKFLDAFVKAGEFILIDTENE